MTIKYSQIPGWAEPSELGRLVNHILDSFGEKSSLKIAEIGVYFGRGTVLFNEILQQRDFSADYYAIDTFEGSAEHRALGQIPDFEEAKDNIHESFPHVRVMKYSSLDASELFQDAFFDVVYIDASHDYHSVVNDMKTWLPKVAKGGCICGDDYISGWPEVIRAVNDMFEGKARVIEGTQQWFYFM